MDGPIHRDPAVMYACPLFLEAGTPKMVRFYFVLCILGFVLPYAALISWLVEQESLNLSALWSSVVGNRLSLMAWLDVIIAAIATAAFIRHEGKRLGLPTVLPALLGTYLVGPSFGLPLFLWMRQKRLKTEVA